MRAREADLILPATFHKVAAQLSHSITDSGSVTNHRLCILHQASRIHIKCVCLPKTSFTVLRIFLSLLTIC